MTTIPVGYSCFYYAASVITGTSTLYLLGSDMICGLIAGTIAKTFTAPFDRLTVASQTSSINNRSIYSQIILSEGILGFWKQNGINIIRATIQKGCLFAFNDLFTYKLNTKNQFVTGMLSGITSTLITYPLDVVKTFNQSIKFNKKLSAFQIIYVLQISNGFIQGPYIALTPTLIGTSLYYGIKFYTFECISNYLNNKYNNNNNKYFNASNNFISGGIAGILGNALLYPNNTIRKSMQRYYTNESANKSGYKIIQKDLIGKKYDKWFNTVLLFYKNEGIKRLYKGYFINLLRNFLNTGIQFVTYKYLQQKLKQY